VKKEPLDNVVPDKALLFLHVPKAAGTTLHSVIERQYSPEVTFTISGSDSPSGIKEFMALPPEEKDKIRLLKGHMPYGLHTQLSVPSTYITMLRDPVDRVVSHYYFVLKTASHYLHNEVVSKKMSLADFVESGLTTEVMNDQTRLISGVAKVNTRLLDGEERRTLQANAEPVTEEILEIAKHNLQNHFAAVGLFSRFDESLVLFKRRLGWNNIYYVRRNVTSGKPNKKELPPRVKDLIISHNELDLALCKFSRQNFEEAVQAGGTEFQLELRTFERNNKLYEKAWRGYYQTRQSIPRVKAMIKGKWRAAKDE
jgi:hypothetical protein